MDKESALQTRLPGTMRLARSHPLTVDDTLRRVTLPPGGWRLYGSSTQVYYTTRSTDAAGDVVAGETAAPEDAGELTDAAAGSPDAGLAWGTGLAGADSGDSVRGGVPLPTDDTMYEEIAVPAVGYVTLYLTVETGSAAPVLVGPLE